MHNHLKLDLLILGVKEYIDGICDYLVDKGVTLIDKDDVTFIFCNYFHNKTF